MKRALVTLALAFLPACVTQHPPRGPSVPAEEGVRGGVVAVSHPLAAAAGAKMLAQGGNAIDAAAAIQFALNVVEPEFSGIGGGGFMMVHLADGRGRTLIIEGREKAPAAASANLFAGQNFDQASTSGSAVGVPGTLKILTTALQRHGRKSLAEVIQPAIELAENGFPVNAVLAASIDPPPPALKRTTLYQVTRDLFRPGATPGNPEGNPLQAGNILRQPDLARTLRLIAAEGPDVFYKGEIAAAIVKAQQMFIPGGRAGLMDLRDLADYDIVIREPIIAQYRGYTIASMPPPSSGGLTMIQALKMLERHPLGDVKAGFGFGKVQTLHVMAEAMRLAFADRAVWMGDEDFVPVPKEGLLDPEYITERASRIKLETRIPGTAPRGWPFDPSVCRDPLATADRPVQPTGSTTHFSVVDHWGNIVSYTTTIEAGWGTGITVPGYGFLLNNELTDFNTTPVAPHPCFGGPGTNDVQGGKRPRSSMTPTILFKGKEPIAAFGSPGGATIISSVYNVIINLVDHGMTLKQAIEAPRISITTAATPVPPSTAVSITREEGFDEGEIAKLKALGHVVGAPGNIGNVNGIFIDPKTGRQYGAVDSTRESGLIALPTPGKAKGKTEKD